MVETLQRDSAAATRKPGWRRRRAWVKLLAWLLAPVVVVAGAFQLQPTYLVLDIPVARHSGGGDFWWDRQFAQQTYADEAGVIYLYRQVGRGFAEPHGWHTLDDAFAHFDHWLTQHGWTLSGPWPSTELLPEAKFLQPQNLRLYYRDRKGTERVHLAIWPSGSDAFHVAIVSERPSWLNRISKGFD